MKHGSLFSRSTTEEGKNKAWYWSSYEKIIDTVDSLGLGHEDMEKQAAYDFAITALGRELAAVSGSYLLKGKVPESDYFTLPFGTPGQIETISLQNTVVIASAWDKGRRRNEITAAWRDGFQPSPKCCAGIYYPELRLAVVESGWHHAAIGALEDTGNADVCRISLAEYFSDVTTDGAYWIFTGKTAMKHPCLPVKNYRLAAMYTLAQHKAQQNNRA